MKVVFNLKNINKLTSILGQDWVEEKFNNYKNEQPKDIHPYIHWLYYFKNVKLSRKVTPPNIFFGMIHQNYSRFDVFSEQLTKHLENFRLKFILRVWKGKKFTLVKIIIPKQQQ